MYAVWNAPFPTLALVDVQTCRTRRPSARLTFPSPNTLPVMQCGMLYGNTQTSQYIVGGKTEYIVVLQMVASQLVSNFLERKKLSQRFWAFSFRPVCRLSTCENRCYDISDKCYWKASYRVWLEYIHTYYIYIHTCHTKFLYFCILYFIHIQFITM